MKGRTWLIGARCATLLPLVAIAQMPGGPEHFRGQFHGGGEGMILQGLQLSTDQQTAIKTIHQASRAQARPMMEQLRQIRTEMKSAMLAAGPVDEAKLSNLQTQASNLRAQLDQLHLTSMVQVRNTLTPEQLQQAASTANALSSLHEQERALMHPPSEPGTAQ
jgi:Spy/CpxP family protein refolding chaperone